MKITKPDDLADAPAIAGYEAENRSERDLKSLKINH